jgi:hypothetical protein
MFERSLARADLCVFAPLAVPGIGGWVLAALARLNHGLGLPGAAEPDESAALFIGLMGLFAACFALMRLQSPAGAWRRHTMAVKAGAALLIGWSVIRGMPALLSLIALADLGAALTLLLRGRTAAAEPNAGPATNHP